MYQNDDVNKSTKYFSVLSSVSSAILQFNNILQVPSQWPLLWTLYFDNAPVTCKLLPRRGQIQKTKKKTQQQQKKQFELGV